LDCILITSILNCESKFYNEPSALLIIHLVSAGDFMRMSYIIEKNSINQEVCENMNKTKILYVEDNNEVRFIVNLQLKIFFSEEEYEIITAENGAEGLEQFYRFFPDLVITDIDMPIMNGAELIKYIRSINNFIPIIITTSHSFSMYRHFCDKYNISCFLMKPFDIENLVNLINDSMNKLTGVR